MKRWWAAKVISGTEYEIKKKVKAIYEDCEIYIPRKLDTIIEDGKIKQSTERLLPGYIIIGTEADVAMGMVEGASVKIIGEVFDEELANLRKQEYTEKEFVAIGSKVIITDGPFMGSKGTVLGTEVEGKTRCRLSFRGMELEVDMKAEYLNTI